MPPRTRKRRYTTVEEQVRYAVARTPARRFVRVSLRDLMYVHQTLGELVRFFHQPLHHTTLEDVHTFIGNRDRGAFHLIMECYYRRLRDVWPRDVLRAYEDGDLKHPDSPYYYSARPHPKPPRRPRKRKKAARPIAASVKPSSVTRPGKMSGRPRLERRKAEGGDR